MKVIIILHRRQAFFAVCVETPPHTLFRTAHIIQIPESCTKLSTGRRKGKFRALQRREKFNLLGVYLGTEDVTILYDTEKNQIEDLPDAIHNDEEKDIGEINVVNKNHFEVASSLLHNQRLFKDVLMSKYFGGDTPLKDMLLYIKRFWQYSYPDRNIPR